MTEGSWIAMPRVPLITAGDPEATAAEEGNVTEGRCSHCGRGDRRRPKKRTWTGQQGLQTKASAPR
jgi:hypothetical protein